MPNIKRLGVAIEMDTGETVMVYTDEDTAGVDVVCEWIQPEPRAWDWDRPRPEPADRPKMNVTITGMVIVSISNSLPRIRRALDEMRSSEVQIQDDAVRASEESDPPAT